MSQEQTPEIDRIQELADFVAGKVPVVINDARDQITEACTAAVESAHESEEEAKEAVLSLSISVKWNLDTNKVEVKLPVKITRNFTASGELEDHEQPALPLVDQDGDPISDRTRRAAAKIRKAVRDGKASVTVMAGAIETTINEAGISFKKGAEL